MVLKIWNWIFAMLLIVASFSVGDGTQGEEQNMGELAAERAISLVGLDIPYHQSTGPSQSKGWENKKFLDSNSPEIKRDGIDCSGLVVWAYNKAAEGTTITYTDNVLKTDDPTSGANAQMISGNILFSKTNELPSESNLRPGDLIFLQNTVGSKSGIDHVAMYVGNGYVVHASANTNSLNNVLATEIKGSQGKITDGPKTANGKTWWEIEYVDGTKGWSSQDGLKVLVPPSDVPAAVVGITQGFPSTEVFLKGSSVEVTSDKGVNVRSTATTTPTGTTMLSLENWLKLPAGDSTYEKHLAGYGGPEGIDIVPKAAPTLAAVAALGLGVPLISPNSATSGISSQNKEGTDETSGTSYINKARDDLWLIDMFDPSFINYIGHYNPAFDWAVKPPVPMYLPSGEQNTYGYDFISLPGIEDHFTDTYLNWVATYLNSIGGGDNGGYGGLLLDEDRSGEDGW